MTAVLSVRPVDPDGTRFAVRFQNGLRLTLTRAEAETAATDQAAAAALLRRATR